MYFDSLRINERAREIRCLVPMMLCELLFNLFRRYTELYKHDSRYNRDNFSRNSLPLYGAPAK